MIGGIGGPGPAIAHMRLASPHGNAEPEPRHDKQVSGPNSVARSASIRASGGNPPVEPAAASEKSKNAANPGLTEEQERAVSSLKNRDTEVRAHEQAHAAAGGSFASAPSYQYTNGPDGRQYAIGGEVQIDSAPVRGNPHATITKMNVVIAAALAPADPSSQDQAVARQAQQARAQAQSELGEQRLNEGRGEKRADASSPGAGQNPQQSTARQLQAQAAYGGLGDGGDSDQDVTAEIFAAAAQLSKVA